MSDDPKNAILCQWAGCPGFFPEFGKPSVRAIMLNMCRVNQGDEHIDIEEKPIHGNSPPNCCTNSDVTRGVPGLTGSRGIPFRVFLPASDGHKARRARVEITSPTLFCCVAANSLAAASTSSSMVRVVRIVDHLLVNIQHQTSYITADGGALIQAPWTALEGSKDRR